MFKNISSTHTNVNLSSKLRKLYVYYQYLNLELRLGKYSSAIPFYRKGLPMPLLNTMNLIKKFELTTFLSLNEDEQKSLAQQLVQVKKNFPQAPIVGYVNPLIVSDDNHLVSDAMLDFVNTVAPKLSLETLHKITEVLIIQSPPVVKGSFMRNCCIAKYFLAYEMMHHEKTSESHFELARMKTEFSPKKVQPDSAVVFKKNIDNLKSTILDPIMSKMGKDTNKAEIIEAEKKLEALLLAQKPKKKVPLAPAKTQKEVMNAIIQTINKSTFTLPKDSPQQNLQPPFNLPKQVYSIHLKLVLNAYETEENIDQALREIHQEAEITLQRLNSPKSRSQEKTFYHYVIEEVSAYLNQVKQAKQPLKSDQDMIPIIQLLSEDDVLTDDDTCDHSELYPSETDGTPRKPRRSSTDSGYASDPSTPRQQIIQPKLFFSKPVSTTRPSPQDSRIDTPRPSTNGSREVHFSDKLTEFSF